jgi:hypothetical protein
MQLFPEGEYGSDGSAANLGSKPVARVTLQKLRGNETGPGTENSPIYNAMFVPDTYRVPYKETKLKAGDVEKLEALSRENVTIVIFQAPEDLEKLGNIAFRAAEIEAGNEGVQQEGFELFRPNEWKKNEYSRLSQNSTHFYNWIIGIVDFKFRLEIILKFRCIFTLK